METLKTLAMMFKKPQYMNLSVVGSPTINNGVVSGFSASDYLTNALIRTNLTDVDCVVNVISQNLSNAINTIMGIISDKNFYLYITNSKQIRLRYYDINNTVITITGNTLLSTPCFVRFKINANGVYLYLSTDKLNWILIGSNETDRPVLTNITELRIGYATSTYNFYDGSLNIGNSYIILDGTKYIYALP